MTTSYLPGTDPELLLKPFFEEEVLRETLDNGLVSIIKPDHSAALVSVQVWVKTGSVHEGDSLGSGLSHYLEHMLFKGTRKRPGAEIAAEVQRHGGNMNAYTSFERTVYYIDLPSEHLEVALDVLADAVFDAVLPADETEREREVILREIDMGNDDPDRTLVQTLFSTAFREHPYRYPVIGYRDVFSALAREDLVSYQRTRYTPNNIVLVISGDVEPARASELISATFGGVERKKVAPVLLPFEPEQISRREEHVFRDVNLSRCALAYKIPGLHHEDAPAIDILSTILGGGKSSLLWKKLRDEQRLVHDIDTMAWKPAGGGLLDVSFTAEAEKREEATEAVVAALDQALNEGFNEAAVTKAIRQALVSEINVRKTISGQASRLGVAEVVAGDLAFSRTYFQRLLRVDPERLVEVGRRYLTPERLTVVSLNPASSRRPGKVARKGLSAEARFEERTLANGAQLLLNRNAKLPNLHLRLLGLGGGAYEAPAKRGVTALLATLLNRDTRKRSAEEVAETIESIGGTFGEFSGNNSFGLSLEVMPADFDLASDLLEQAVRSPVFQEDTFQREKDSLLAEIREELDEVLSFGMKRLRARFFGRHPLGVDDSGTLETVAALTVDDVADQYRRLVRPGNLVLSAAGDFGKSEDRVVERLTQLLESLPGEPFEPASTAFSGPAETGDFVEFQPRQQAVVLQGYPDCGIQDESFRTGEVVDELLSGMSSRLFERVREKLGLAYYVGSGRIAGLREGMFYLYAGTHPDAVDAVKREMADELRRIRDGGVTPEELDRCRVRLKTHRRGSMQTNGARAMLAGLNVLYGRPANEWLEYDRQVDAIQLDDLQKFARKYLREDRKVSLVVRPGEGEVEES